MSTKNLTRDFPMQKEFLGDKKMNDIIYGFLQTNSYLTPTKKRYCWRSEVTAGKIIEYFKEQETESPIAERTIRNLLKLFAKINLLEEGEYEGKKVYYLPDITTNYVIIKTETLRFLVNTANTNVIKVYAQLKKMWECHKKYQHKEKYRFSKADLLTAIGYTTIKSYSENFKMIEDILQCLQNNELIEIHKEGIVTGSGQATEYYELDCVNDDYRKTLSSKAKEDNTVCVYPVAETPIEYHREHKEFIF